MFLYKSDFTNPIPEKVKITFIKYFIKGNFEMVGTKRKQYKISNYQLYYKS